MTSFELERDHVGPGWQPIIEKLHAELLKIDPDYEVDQIKEKFGELRYYHHTELTQPAVHDTMNKLVEDAAQASAKTCEYCGQPAKTKIHQGWYKTLCDNCGKVRKASREATAK